MVTDITKASLTEKPVNQDTLEKFLNDRMEQLSRQSATYEDTTRQIYNLVQLLLRLGTLLTACSVLSIFTLYIIKTNYIVSLSLFSAILILAIVGILSTILSGLLFLQRRNENIQVKSYFLDKIF